jgi:radical SAM protein (TIGR01212 family)
MQERHAVMRPPAAPGHAGADAPPRWNRISDHFFRRFGERVRKIPLDAGFSCPNRDGTLSRHGCIFCNPQGSGTGFALAGLDLAGQWAHWQKIFHLKGVHRFMAYLQSFSNTYGTCGRFSATLRELAALPEMVGLSVGTRPDCVDAQKLEILAGQPQADIWIEFGVQSSNDATLRRINRGHDRACAERAIRAAAAAGLQVCVHRMAGLPGETREDFLESTRWASNQAIHGLKFHCLYVCRDTALAGMFARGAFTPLAQDAYVSLMADALPLLRPDIIIHRTTGDPFSGEMLAPPWIVRSRDTNNKLMAELARRDAWQGQGWRV